MIAHVLLRMEMGIALKRTQSRGRVQSIYCVPESERSTPAVAGSFRGTEVKDVLSLAELEILQRTVEFVRASGPKGTSSIENVFRFVNNSKGKSGFVNNFLYVKGIFHPKMLFCHYLLLPGLANNQRTTVKVVYTVW